MPHVSLLISGYEPDSWRSSGMRSPFVRTPENSMVPQLDGPRSLPTRDPIQRRMDRPPDPIEQDTSQGGMYVQKTAISRRREYSEEEDDSDDYRRPPQDPGSFNKRQADRIFVSRESGGKFPNQPPDREGPPGGRPSDRGEPPGGGYPGGGPPNGGGPPGGQGRPGPQGPPAPVRPIIVQMPQVTLDTPALENTFNTVGQSMMQLARAQDQTNRQLQQQIQQGHVNLQAHTGALQQLATSTYQRNFDHIFC